MSSVYYSDYLQLDSLLGAQRPLSDIHDEMLFITTHQVYEIWFKQVLYEIKSIIGFFSANSLDERHLVLCVNRLKRVHLLQNLMNDQIAALETMTPMDFLEFRDKLHPASGFQSIQFRELEVLLGYRYRAIEMAPIQGRLSKKDSDLLEKTSKVRGLFDLVDDWLSRMPFLQESHFIFFEEYHKAVLKMFSDDIERIKQHPDLSEEQKERQIKIQDASRAQFSLMTDPREMKKLIEEGKWRLSYRASMASLMIFLYREIPALQMPFTFLQGLIDLDELFATWRYRHALLAKRMLGDKIGTGGSSGHDYLVKSLEGKKIFSDFVNLSSFLIPQSARPKLPDDLIEKMQFRYV